MLFFDGLARLVQLNNINFDMTDLKKALVSDLLKKKSLILFSLGFLDEESQYKLADYVKHGGNLIINPYLPDKNLLMKRNRCLEWLNNILIQCPLHGNNRSLTILAVTDQFSNHRVVIRANFITLIDMGV